MEITNKNNEQQLAIPVRITLLERVELLEYNLQRAEEKNIILMMMVKGATEGQNQINTRLDEFGDVQVKMMKNFKHSVTFGDQPIVEQHVYDQDAIIHSTPTQTPSRNEKDKKKSGSIRKRGEQVIGKKPKTVMETIRRSPRLRANQNKK
ncbi:unnamed protein product [Caenorhabditis angaria]|uniref:Uncharacterized protein n=1 Tax=Caenorhabditis angaria TaxID=860376 RepID=A0A9P1N1G3_9PELO|nr:unnamed protein product [Caenorhabditis angaria]